MRLADRITIKNKERITKVKETIKETKHNTQLLVKKTSPRCNFYNGNVTINKLQKFNYVGIKVGGDGKCDTKIRRIVEDVFQNLSIKRYKN